MGLFGKLIDDAKSRVEKETQPVLDSILNEEDIQYVVWEVQRALKKGLSIIARAKVIQAFQYRIRKEDPYRLLNIFRQLYADRSDNTALVISQWIGKELYDKGYNEVEQKEIGEGKHMYVPNDRY